MICVLGGGGGRGEGEHTKNMGRLYLFSTAQFQNNSSQDFGKQAVGWGTADG